MIISFLLAIELCLTYFSICVHSRSHSAEYSDKPQPADSLHSRQIPGVISADQFLRRAFHACECSQSKVVHAAKTDRFTAIVAGEHVYIDGGDFSWTNNDETNYDYCMSID